jgi:hypothetical protein
MCALAEILRPAKSHRAAADAHGKNDHAKANARNQSQAAHEKSQQQK